MVVKNKSFLANGQSLLIATGACLLMGATATAQDAPPAPAQGYKVGETKNNSSVDNQKANQKSEAQRAARINFISGKVTWRANDSAVWANAKMNLPLHQDSQIWVTDGGRAEVQFDDGSVLRLGNNSVATFQMLYSDSEGKFTEIKMISGLATLRLKQEGSVYQVDTPTVTVKTTGPSRVRIGVAETVEVGVRVGKATIEGKQGKTTLAAGDFVSLRDGDAPYDKSKLPGEDSWERWNDERDYKLFGGKAVYPGPRPVYVPAYYPAPSVFFSFGIPIYGGRYWGGRGFGHGWR